MIVEHVIAIAAPPHRIWSVTLDVERWPEWTPTVRRIQRVAEQPLGPGSVVRIRQPGQPESEWTVTAFEPGRRLTWETRRAGLRMTATHALTPAGDGTSNLLRLEARGILSVLLWPVLRPAVGWALSQENRGLKARCERGA